MTKKHLIRIAALASAFLPALAFAHPGHGEASSFAAGAVHPLSGIDHLAGFLIVGMLAAQLGGRYWWPMSAAFLGLLAAAGTADSAGWQYAAGFMFSGAGLVAAGVLFTGAATRAFGFPLTADARRSRT